MGSGRLLLRNRQRERLLLFDAIAPPSEIETLAAGRETAVVLTAPWHARDAQGLVERLEVPVYTPLTDTAEDLMRQFGITAEQAGERPQTAGIGCGNCRATVARPLTMRTKGRVSVCETG